MIDLPSGPFDLVYADPPWRYEQFTHAEKRSLGDPEHSHRNGKWVSLTLAYSALGKALTGLPIDFQIQQASHANFCFPDQPRSALGLVPHRFRKDASQ